MKSPQGLNKISKIEKMNFFISLFENSPIPKSILSIAEKKYVFVNAAWEKFTGFSKKEAVGKTALDLKIITKESDALLSGEVLNKNETIPYEHFIRLKNGIEKTILGSFDIISINKEDFILNTISNLDDLNIYKVQQERVLIKRTHELLSAKDFIIDSIENMSDGFVSLNTDWIYTYVNTKAGEFLDRKPSDLIGKHIWTEFTEGVGLPFYKAYYKAVETGQTQYIKEYFEPIDKWFENRIYPSSEGLSIYFTDVTERVKNEERLIKSKRHLNRIINNIGDPLFVKDDQSRILIVNDAFCKMFNLSRADIVGKTLAEDVSPEEQEVFLRIDKQVLASGIENINEESLTVRDNEARIISTKKTRYVDKSGAKFLIGTIRDLTERKRAEANNQMLLSLIETSDDFIGLASLEGKPIYLNVLGKKMIGLEADAKLPASISDFFSKHLRDAIKNEQLPSIYKNGKWHGEVQFINFKTGDLIPIEMSSFLIKDRITNKNLALGIVAANITERKQTEIRLQKSESSLLEAQKTARLGSFKLDLKTQILETSTSFNDIAELDVNSKISLDFWNKITHPEDVIATNKAFKVCIETQGKINIEYRIFTKITKELKWVHGLGEVVFIDGVAAFFFGTIQDITERKLAENKISLANEQLTLANSELNVLRKQLEQENVYLRNEIDLVFNYEEMVYGSETFSNVLTEVEKVAPTNATVLLLGESGTGKELLARAIHKIGLRNNKPLIKVNCSAIPRELIESELFGHKKGSFTGAFSDKTGKFELADGGTLFLDEIGELPLDMQPKILRFLQEGEIEVVGGTSLKKLDVRVIAATNKNLKEEIEKKQFREDLFFRLNVFPIEVPPLRKRRDDIPLLVEHFVNKFNKVYEKDIKYIPDESMNKLKTYNWPGNIRELENLIERALILSNNNTLLIPGFETALQMSKQLIVNKDSSLSTAQRNHILQILEDCKWKISGPNGAAELLELKPSTLRDKMTKLNIVKPLKK